MSSLVVLITGCSAGIGKDLAVMLARDPQRRFRVYATSRNMAKRQEELKTEAGGTVDDTMFIRDLDVTKQDSIDNAVGEIIKEEGKIDVLVNNAAIQCGEWWETCSMDAFYDTMEVNYFGQVRMTRAVAPHMKQRRSGRILQIASILGFHAIPVSTQYVATKYALRGFAESIAPPLRKYNVWVSVIIEPGYVKTKMVQQFGPTSSDCWAYVASHIPDEADRKLVTDMVTFDPEIVIEEEMQEPEVVAKVIQDAMLAPKPDFRYQTSQTIKRMSRETFVDPTCNTIMDAWMKEK